MNQFRENGDSGEARAQIVVEIGGDSRTQMLQGELANWDRRNSHIQRGTTDDPFSGSLDDGRAEMIHQTIHSKMTDSERIASVSPSAAG